MPVVSKTEIPDRGKKRLARDPVQTFGLGH